MPTLTIFAGVNGAGKTTLYRQKKDALKDLGIRINADEILKDYGGNDRSVKDFVYATEIFKKRFEDCISRGLSCNVETTIMSTTHIKYIKLAKSKNYKINLNFVYAESVEECKKRVQHRVEQGGHYVPEALITNRFKAQLKMLDMSLNYIDNCFFYENKEKFKVVGIIKDNMVDYQDLNCLWFNEFVKSLSNLKPNEKDDLTL